MSLGCSSRLIHGYTTDGTFAEYTVSRSSDRKRAVYVLSNLLHFKLAWTYYVTPIPKSLDSAAATSILCAVGTSLTLSRVPST